MSKLVFQHRRGTKEQWNESTIKPKEGEIVVEKNSGGKIKVGDGHSLYKELPYVTDAVEDAVNVVNARVDNLIVRDDDLTEESIREVADIRVGYDGITYGSAGDAVRQVGNEVKELRTSLQHFINADAVDGLLYEDNMLQLMADGVPVGDPVGPISGGTGGGGGSSIIIRLVNEMTDDTGSPINTFTVTSGSEVNLKFRFTSTEDDIPTGAGTCVITVNGTQKAKFSIEQGSRVVPVGEYLSTGDNSIKVTCTDIYGNARHLVYNISSIELVLKSSFDYTKQYTSNIDFRYSVVGSVDKTVYFELDNSNIATVNLSASTSNRETVQIIRTSGLSHGVHKLKVYAIATVGGITVPSNELIYDVMIHLTSETAPMIASVLQVDEVEQGDLVSIPYIVFHPNHPVCKVELSISSMVGGKDTPFGAPTELEVTSDLQFWNVRNYPSGDEVKFSISYTYAENVPPLVKTHILKINEASIQVDGIPGTKLFLSSSGRHNTEAQPGKWDYTYVDSFTGDTTTYTSTFNGFNYKSNGWVEDEVTKDTCLRLNGGATVTVNYNIFNFNILTSGLTFEIEFSVKDVNNRDTVIFECFDYSKNVGIRATADKAIIRSAANEVSCNYKDNERVRLAFTIDKDGKTMDGYDSAKFLSIYLDGILSGIVSYTDNDFKINKPLTLGDPEGKSCLDVYNIRVYDRALTFQEVTQNYISDVTEMDKKIHLYNDNDIYDSDMKLSYEELKKRIPTITFTGQMPTYKGDKRVVLMDFENPFDESKNFKNVYGGPIQVEIDVQGTSSQYYVRKNWKIKLKKKDKKTGKTIFDHDPYQHMNDELPSQVFCIKVDYAEGTGTHNTQNANFVETLYDKTMSVDKNDTISYIGDGWLLPQKDDQRVRTTITGFPCVIFERAEEGAEPVFSSKGNFNFDKDSEDTFGFNDKYDTECWEFCNNANPAPNFLEEIPANWVADFEPRYFADSDAVDRMEELQEKNDEGFGEDLTPEQQENLEGLTEAERAELLSLRESSIARFKKMHDWVRSTNGDQSTNEPFESPVVFKDNSTWNADTKEYRLAKFRNEFEDYFNLHYSAVYYLYTFVALMVDQRAKNLFLTYWESVKGDPTTGRWYPYFYDNDTCFGINNTGYMAFDYFHEDTDYIDLGQGRTPVYNGQSSVLWNNFRTQFASEIKDTYATLRSDKKLTYEKLINQIIENGSSMWSASVYNEDAEFKYVTMARPENASLNTNGKVDTRNLYQVKGNGEYHLKYFLDNRIKYCDSKWMAGDYDANKITFRLNSPELITDGLTDEEVAAITPNHDITLIPFSTTYVGVQYGANGTTYHRRAYKNEDITIKPANSGKYSNTEAAVFGASEISSLGDLSLMYLDTLDISKGQRLTELIVGSDKKGYKNAILAEVTLGTNSLLETIDVTNCVGLKSPIDAGNCSNIRTIKAFGTSITDVILPESGYVETLKLPNTLTSLYLTNQLLLKDASLPTDKTGLYIDGVDSISKLCIDNCTGVDGTALFRRCLERETVTLTNVRLTNVDWVVDSWEDLRKLYLPTQKQLDDGEYFIGDNGNYIRVHLNGDTTDTGIPSSAGFGYGLRGIKDRKETVDTVSIYGKCHINSDMIGRDMLELLTYIPNLTFSCNKIDLTVTFMSDDGQSVLHTEHIETQTLEDVVCADPVSSGAIDAPTRESTVANHYTWNGWSINPDANRQAQVDALINIRSDRVLYPAFKEQPRSYTVTFYTGDNILHSTTVKCYCNAVFSPSIVEDASLLIKVDYEDGSSEYVPKKMDTANPEAYDFASWYPSADNIQGDTNCYAQFTISSDGYHTVTLSDIESTTVGNDLTIEKYLNTYESVIRVPETLGNAPGETYSVVGINGAVPTTSGSTEDYKGFATTPVEVVLLPDTLTTIGASAFEQADKLTEINIPRNVTTIGTRAIAETSSMMTVKFDAVNAVALNPTSTVTGYPFEKAGGNDGFDLVLGDDVVEIPAYMFFQGSRPSDSTAVKRIYFGENTKCSRIGMSSFVRCNLEELTLPDTIRYIGNSSFMHNTKISELKLNSGLELVEMSAFQTWNALKEVYLPKTVYISWGAFRYCPSIEKFTIEEDSRYSFVSGCLIDNDTKMLIVGTKNSKIPNDGTVTAIADYAFSAVEGLDSVRVPSTITTIPIEGFIRSSVKEVILPSNLTRINQLAFYQCASIESIVLPQSLEVLDASSFGYCTSLKSIDIPELCTQIGALSFSNCSSMETATIRAKSVQIGTDYTGKRSLFSGCRNLKKINVGWKEGEIPDAPWGAPDGVEIVYEYEGD